MKFYLDPRPSKDGKQAIVIRGRYLSGKPYRFFVTSVFKEARIKAADWKQKDQKVMGNPKLGETLKKIKTVLEQQVLTQKVLNPSYDIPDAWKDLYETKSEKEKEVFPQKVIAAIPIYKEYFKGKKSHDYLRILDQLHIDLSGWNPDITFSKLNFLSLENFKEYLMSDKRKIPPKKLRSGKIKHMEAKPLESSTIYSRFKYLRELSTLAQRHGLPVDPAVFDYKVKYIHRSGGFALTYQELMKVFHYESENKTRMAARDYFLMEAFTGIRNSDCQALRNANVHQYFIEYSDQKNDGKIKTVTRHKLNNAIIKRHYNAKNPNDFLLPQIAQGTINIELKFIARELKLNRLISRKGELRPLYKCLATHSGRHSYATLLNQIGVPHDYIQEEIGHSQGLTFGTYTHRYDRYEVISEAINALPLVVENENEIRKLRKVV
jgi:integrase